MMKEREEEKNLNSGMKKLHEMKETAKKTFTQIG